MSRQLNSRSGPRTSGIGTTKQIQSNGDYETNMWSAMLDSVSSGKKLPEKNLIVLGRDYQIGCFANAEIVQEEPPKASPSSSKHWLQIMLLSDLKTDTEESLRRPINLL